MQRKIKSRIRYEPEDLTESYLTECRTEHASDRQIVYSENTFNIINIFVFWAFSLNLFQNLIAH